MKTLRYILACFLFFVASTLMYGLIWIAIFHPEFYFWIIGIGLGGWLMWDIADEIRKFFLELADGIIEMIIK